MSSKVFGKLVVRLCVLVCSLTLTRGAIAVYSFGVGR